MTYVDFAFVRKHVTVEQAATWLGLDLKPANNQLRGSARCMTAAHAPSPSRLNEMNGFALPTNARRVVA